MLVFKTILLNGIDTDMYVLVVGEVHLGAFNLTDVVSPARLLATSVLN